MISKVDIKRFDSVAKGTVKCKCSHSITMTPKHPRVICSYCGHYAYRTKLDEFKDKLIMERRLINE